MDLTASDTKYWVFQCLLEGFSACSDSLHGIATAGEGKGASVTRASPAAVIKSAQQDHPNANMNILHRIIYSSRESGCKTTNEATFTLLFGSFFN